MLSSNSNSKLPILLIGERHDDIAFLSYFSQLVTLLKNSGYNKILFEGTGEIETLIPEVETYIKNLPNDKIPSLEKLDLGEEYIEKAYKFKNDVTSQTEQYLRIEYLISTTRNKLRKIIKENGFETPINIDDSSYANLIKKYKIGISTIRNNILNFLKESIRNQEDLDKIIEIFNTPYTAKSQEQIEKIASINLNEKDLATLTQSLQIYKNCIIKQAELISNEFRMVDERDNSMLEKIIKEASQNNIVIRIGIAHMSGISKKLQELGYNVIEYFPYHETSIIQSQIDLFTEGKTLINTGSSKTIKLTKKFTNLEDLDATTVELKDQIVSLSIKDRELKPLPLKEASDKFMQEFSHRDKVDLENLEKFIEKITILTSLHKTSINNINTISNITNTKEENVGFFSRLISKASFFKKEDKNKNTNYK
ncbi:MAG: TraB/GumN family protein [Sphingobacteriia bacterium]|nr:TraB/GumN family protein [Sphingobacteriia bacterium]